MQLDGMPGWDIEKQSITGMPGSALCYSTGDYYVSIVDLDQESVVFITDSTEYPYSAIDSLNYDNHWYTICLEKDEEAEGYLRLPKKLAGSRNVKIMLNLMQDGNSDPIPVTFYLEEC